MIQNKWHTISAFVGCVIIRDYWAVQTGSLNKAVCSSSLKSLMVQICNEESLAAVDVHSS